VQVEIEVTYKEVKEIIAQYFAVPMDEVRLSDLQGNEELSCFVVAEGNIEEMANFGKEEV